MLYSLSYHNSWKGSVVSDYISCFCRIRHDNEIIIASISFHLAWKYFEEEGKKERVSPCIDRNALQKELNIYTYIDIYVYRIFTIYDIESIIGRYLNICRLSFDSLIKVKTTNTIDLMTKHLLKTTEYRLQWRSFQKIVVFDIHVITQKVIIVSWIDYSFYDMCV